MAAKRGGTKLARRAALHALACVATACGLAACSNSSDELYCDPSCEPTTPPEPPVLPIKPDSANVDACEACAMVQCGDQRAACLEDDACTAQLGCTAECDDPGCLQMCQAEHGVKENGIAGWFSPWWDDLYVCAFRSCATECNAGANWECVDRFSWPAAEEATLQLRVRLADDSGFWRLSAGDDPGGFPLAGARVRTCPSTGCAFGPLDDGVLDASSTAVLDFPADGGYLEVDDDEAGRIDARYRIHPIPIGRSIEVLWPVGDPATWLQSYGELPGPNQSLVWVGMSDCTGSPARVRFELPGKPDIEVVDEPLGLRGIAAFLTAVAPAKSEIVIRATTEIGDEVANRTLATDNGWTANLALGPRASGE